MPICVSSATSLPHYPHETIGRAIVSAESKETTFPHWPRFFPLIKVEAATHGCHIGQLFLHLPQLTADEREDLLNSERSEHQHVTIQLRYTL
jgi:hypothetical protein